MPLKHGPIEAVLFQIDRDGGCRFSMPLKHGPIEAYLAVSRNWKRTAFSMPLKHGPIEAGLMSDPLRRICPVFHAPKAWPH